MVKQVEGQLAFDFEELTRQAALDGGKEWTGAPLGFTQDFYTPEEFEEAFDHWRLLHGSEGSIPRSHMWHQALWNPQVVRFAEHRGQMVTAELGPEHGHEGPGCLLSQMICEPCRWHAIGGSENSVVEQWHDHAVPGWRELPVIPAAVRIREGSRHTGRVMTWIKEHYPAHMQVPGAPIITEREPSATRHVAGYSPWNGYDLSHTALASPPTRQATRRVIQPFQSATPTNSRPHGRVLGV